MYYLLFLPGILLILHGIIQVVSNNADSKSGKSKQTKQKKNDDTPYVTLGVVQRVPTVAEALRGKPKDGR